MTDEFLAMLSRKDDALEKIASPFDFVHLKQAAMDAGQEIGTPTNPEAAEQSTPDTVAQAAGQSEDPMLAKKQKKDALMQVIANLQKSPVTSLFLQNPAPNMDQEQQVGAPAANPQQGAQQQGATKTAAAMKRFKFQQRLGAGGKLPAVGKDPAVGRSAKQIVSSKQLPKKLLKLKPKKVSFKVPKIPAVPAKVEMNMKVPTRGVIKDKV